MDFREKELSEDCSESKKSTDIIPDDVRTLFVWVCSVAVGSLISRAGFFFPGLIFTGPATVTEFLFIAGGTYTVSAGAAVIFRRTGKRNLCFFVILFLHKVSLSFI